MRTLVKRDLASREKIVNIVWGRDTFKFVHKIIRVIDSVKGIRRLVRLVLWNEKNMFIRSYIDVRNKSTETMSRSLNFRNSIDSRAVSSRRNNPTFGHLCITELLVVSLISLRYILEEYCLKQRKDQNGLYVKKM